MRRRRRSSRGECFDPLDQSAEHHKEWGDQPTIKFFPFHVTAEITNVFLLLCVYLLLAVLRPAGLETRANPLITPVGIKPEWYFLFLYAFMHYVPPVVGTLAPLVGLGLLAAMPVDRPQPRARAAQAQVAIAGSILRSGRHRGPVHHRDHGVGGRRWPGKRKPYSWRSTFLKFLGASLLLNALLVPGVRHGDAAGEPGERVGHDHRHAPGTRSAP